MVMKIYKVMILMGLMVTKSFGQNLHFDSLRKIETQINSQSDEMKPLLSPDGEYLYFTRAFSSDNVGGLNYGSDIWRCSLSDDSLTITNEIGKWNNKENNALVGISENSNIFYLLNSYNKASGIAFSKGLNGSLTKPEVIELEGILRQGFVDLYVAPGYDVIIVSMEGEESSGQEDLYVILRDKNGNWELPINLGSTVNTAGFELSPFLSPDRKTLYFSSNGHDGFGDADIYKSERLHNSWTVWSKPENLGSAINSISFDAYFSIYGDTVCYYSSNREGQLDIYSSRVSKEEMRSITSYSYLSKGDLLEIFGFLPNQEIHFDNDSSFAIAPQEKESLWLIANKIKEMDNIYILVNNHGNNLEEKTKMERFSQVSYFLQSRGVSLFRIQMNDSTLSSETNKVKLDFFSR